MWGEWKVECRGVEQVGEGLTATNLLLTNTHSGDTHSLTHTPNQSSSFMLQKKHGPPSLLGYLVTWLVALAR